MGPNIGPKWDPRGPPNRPKSAFEIDLGTPFFGFDVGKPWKIDLGAIWGFSWGHLGPILGVSGAILVSSWAILGHLEAILVPSGAILGIWVPSWAPLGPTWGHLGPSWGHLGPLLAILGPSCGHSMSGLFVSSLAALLYPQN